MAGMEVDEASAKKSKGSDEEVKKQESMGVSSVLAKIREEEA